MRKDGSTKIPAVSSASCAAVGGADHTALSQRGQSGFSKVPALSPMRLSLIHDATVIMSLSYMKDDVNKKNVHHVL
jgi:hypothetical protein